jgi:hypothetical protein
VANVASARSALAAAKAAEIAMDAVEARSGDPSSIVPVIRAASEAAGAGESSRALLEFAKTTPIYRVHQEDACQTLRVHPSRKYQNEGGPGPNLIIDLLRSHIPARRRSRSEDGSPDNAEDVSTFMDALILN